MKSETSSVEKQLSMTPTQLLNFVVSVGGHWIFQSILYMDRTERLFKLTLDVLLTLFFALVLTLWLHWLPALIIGFLLAHTMNFVFNAQLCALSVDYGFVSLDYNRLKDYTQALGRRAEAEPSIEYVAICGSLAQETWTVQSDLDVRILRRPGFVNGIRAGWFVLKERSRAQFDWFPLDIYLFDSDSAIRAKLKSHEALNYLPSRQ